VCFCVGGGFVGRVVGGGGGGGGSAGRIMEILDSVGLKLFV